MTRKHFRLIAETLKNFQDQHQPPPEQYQALCLSFARSLHTTNPNFQETRFLRAAGCPNDIAVSRAASSNSNTLRPRRGMNMAESLYAVQHIRRMRGGSQAHLLRASDGCFYVTKFQNNPQHIRVLASEYLATRLGIALGLPMPEVRIIDVSDWLIANSPELRIEIAGQLSPCASGLQLASRYAADPEQDHIFDYLPEAMVRRIANLDDFQRVLAFDKWTCNSDGRQAVFIKHRAARLYQAMFIDQGYCFNAGEWNFPDSPLRGVFSRNYVYEQVIGWNSFEPMLSRIENIELSDLTGIATEIPPEWYQHDSEGLTRLPRTLHERRSLIRDLITSFRNSTRNPFPNWTD